MYGQLTPTFLIWWPASHLSMWSIAANHLVLYTGKLNNKHITDMKIPGHSKEIRVGNIATCPSAKYPYGLPPKLCILRSLYLLPKNKSWMTFCYLQHRRPAHQQDLCCHFSASKNAHRLMRTAKIWKKTFWGRACPRTPLVWGIFGALTFLSV